MKPVVLIATDKRIDITKRNIESLLSQSVKPIVFIVCTNPKEAEIYRAIGAEVLAGINNKPLGRKWQAGVDKIKRLGYGPLIITGSDDILGDGFIENACRLVESGYHFIGLKQWYQHHKGMAYKCQYLANQPLGGGRVYSKEMLEVSIYKIFDTMAIRRLDDLGWKRVNLSGLKTLILDEPENEGLSIHAIKGDWEMLNKFNVEHKNIRLLKQLYSSQALPSFFANIPKGENANSFIDV